MIPGFYDNEGPHSAIDKKFNPSPAIQDMEMRGINDAEFYPATRGPWDMVADGGLRDIKITDPARYSVSSREDLSWVFEMSNVMGHEGFDYQNPNVWAGRGVLDYPTPYGTALDPKYGVQVNAYDTADNIALNVQATKGVIQA